MQRPTSLGLFLCERFSLEQGSGRRSLLFMFEELTADEFPYTSPPFTVYAELTDGQGRVPIDLAILDIDGHSELVATTLILTLPHPLAVAHLLVRCPE